MDEPEYISLDQCFDDSSSKSKHSLVGKIITFKTLNKVGVQNVINKAWKTEDSFFISALGNNTYAFHFQSEDDLWLPLGYQNEASGKIIAKSLGDLISIQDPNDWRNSVKCLRLRVWIDINKPLKKGFFLKRSNMEDLWVPFKYERLSEYCFECGRIGHSIPDCKWKETGATLSRAFDCGLRADISLINVINYGVRPPEVVAYPKTGVQLSREGGQDGGAWQERVERLLEDIPVSTIIRDMMNFGDKEGARQEGQVPITKSYSCPEENIREPAEEPDSPRASQTSPSTVTQKLFSLEVDQDRGFIKTPLSPRAPMEVALSTVFDRLLSLKRKEREDDETPQNFKKSGHLIPWKENAPAPTDTPSLSTSISSPVPPPCFPVSRGRGGQSLPGNRGKKSTSVRRYRKALPCVEEEKLVDVQVLQSDSVPSIPVADVGDQDRAVVAGPNQPQSQWWCSAGTFRG
ncbi:hypothetical protein RHSIM_Rhsim12G0079700 [Rhododendron simsii]|uniref:CCHC-type domain-containing protein n=1 Tax=Rhododendron simsii TaxID=118357 RepID=A0A834G383_RHOSS|nr:hypothetical protein RHSIM_Rhsim12G0079700 [Rhododendron simsii]